jgi:hypothetical protein
MPNRHRGEVAATFDGVPYTLCLTLGALAELESAFGDADMLALTERFASGRISARDATRILGAGLRASGHAVSDDDVARMQPEHGAAGAVAVVAELLAATFGGPLAGAVVGTAARALTDDPPAARPASASTASREAVPRPFPGAR